MWKNVTESPHRTTMLKLLKPKDLTSSTQVNWQIKTILKHKHVHKPLTDAKKTAVAKCEKTCWDSRSFFNIEILYIFYVVDKVIHRFVDIVNNCLV